MMVWTALKSICRLATIVFTVCILPYVSATVVLAQQDAEVSQEDDVEILEDPDEAIGDFTFLPVRTDSPRETLNSFIRLTWLLESAIQQYRAERNHQNRERISILAPAFLQLIDLTEVPEATRREVGEDTIGYLLDIFGRIDLPPLKDVPDEDAFEDEEKPAKWRIPGTPIKIVRIEEAPFAGEFLFSGRTVDVAPRAYQHMRHRPLRSTLGIESWTEVFAQFHGPMIPAGLVASLPAGLKQFWLGTPIWKILTVMFLAVAAMLMLILWHRMVNAVASKRKVTVPLYRLLSPAAIIAVTLALEALISVEVDVSGEFSRAVEFTATLTIYLALVWIFWLVVITISEWIILSPRIPDSSLDANLLRLTARVVGFVGSVVILAYGVQALGLPGLGLLAGLGVGGLAVALAVRPTLENLIGGAILYIDRPVRIGDRCTFSGYTGTVESIGVRSTQVRALDRTLVTIPNANFANMELINWAKCDKMMIRTNIGLRYETEPDQLRYLLANLREMCYAHPKIDPETVRIRFAGYGASSFDVDFRIHALTQEMNEFFAIREDVLLRVNDIVAESGTSFAFPSQTLYMGRDKGMDEERTDTAVQQVQSWRRNGNLPFPRFTDEKIEQMAGTLDYPPHGSPQVDGSKAATYGTAEPLSQDTESEDTGEEDEAEKT